MAGLYTMLAILVPMMIGSVLTLVRPTPVDLDDVNHAVGDPRSGATGPPFLRVNDRSDK